MSAHASAPPAAWLNQVTPEERHALYKRARTLDAEMAENHRAIRWGGYVVGGVGAAIGLAGMVAAASLFPLKTVETRVVAVDSQTGTVTQMVAAKDAAPLFTEKTAQRDLLAYVEAREMWVNDVSDLMARRVLLMSSPDEQRVYEAATSPKNPAAPRNVFGTRASVRIDAVRFAMIAKAPVGTSQVWQVRFKRMEVVNGQLMPGKEWVATVTFSWQPDLPLQDERTRAINLTGFQATSYHSEPA